MSSVRAASLTIQIHSPIPVIPLIPPLSSGALAPTGIYTHASFISLRLHQAEGTSFPIRPIAIWSWVSIPIYTHRMFLDLLGAGSETSGLWANF